MEFKKSLNSAPALIAAVTLLAIIVGIVGGLRGGNDTDRFTHENFANTRPSQVITADMPHGQIAIEHIRFMSDNLYNRFGFSYRELKAAEWIVEELLAMGYSWEDITVQEFTFNDIEFFPIYGVAVEYMASMVPLYFFIDMSPFINLNIRRSRQSQNIILTIPGQSEQFIIVGAHYDTMMFPGASDNASGTALLLESAQRMRYIDNYYTIIYVFFGAEEVGLVGAFYYANSLSDNDHENLLFMLNADVLLEGPDLFYMGGYNNFGRPGANHITKIWDAIAYDISLRYGVPLRPKPDGIYGPSDHLVFLPWSHTVMFMIGLDLSGYGDGTNVDLNTLLANARVLHSPRDEFHYINESWPGKMEQNMMIFSIFLEELLLADYY